MRLFDRPAAYHGGPMEVFQRAEASTFFGREIGIMYTHAHLRYAEALARVGDGPGLLARAGAGQPRRDARAGRPGPAPAVDDVLLLLRRRVPRPGGGRTRLRQVRRRHRRARGWLARLLLRARGSTYGSCASACSASGCAGERVEIDPVLPLSLDGLVAQVRLFGRTVDVAYSVRGAGYGATRITVDGQKLPDQRLENRYRTGGLSVASDELRNLLGPEAARIDVEVS